MSQVQLPANQKLWYAWTRLSGNMREVTVIAEHRHIAKEMLVAQYGKQAVESDPFEKN